MFCILKKISAAISWFDACWLQASHQLIRTFPQLLKHYRAQQYYRAQLQVRRQRQSYYQAQQQVQNIIQFVKWVMIAWSDDFLHHKPKSYMTQSHLLNLSFITLYKQDKIKEFVCLGNICIYMERGLDDEP